MIKKLAYIIAFAITLVVVAVLYPVAIIFWAIGKLGDLVGMISGKIFQKSNEMVKRLWAEVWE